MLTVNHGGVKVKIPDAGGEEITLFKFPNNLLLDAFFDKTDFHAISSLPLRDDDVMIVSYPRSGVHWLWEQVRMILAGRHDLDDILEKDAGMLEFHFKGQIDALPSPKVLNSHLLFRHLPADMLKKKTKTIFLYRNPKDVAVSFYKFHSSFAVYEYEGQFGNWLKLFQKGTVDWGSYTDYLRDWEKEIEKHPELPVHLIRYEDLKKKPVEELSRLCGFLGKERNEEFLQQVSEATTIDTLRTRKSGFWESGDFQSKASSYIYRKGDTGTWKNTFTVTQNEEFDRWWEKEMAGSTFFSFTY